MIFETGYIWTQASNDGATNIISETHPSYAPASPTNQRKWLTDLTQEVINKGGEAVMYWEPAWVSTPCRTPWGQGSHQEHATFFDFDENMQLLGGMTWPKFPYLNLSETLITAHASANCQVTPEYDAHRLRVELSGFSPIRTVQANFFNSLGQSIGQKTFDLLQDGSGVFYWNWPSNANGLIFMSISDHQSSIYSGKVHLR